MTHMNAATQDRRIKRANQEWDRMTSHARESFSAILDRVESSEHEFGIDQLAKSWVVLTHPSVPFKVQLVADSLGSNLDLSIYRPGEDNYFVSPLSSVKLTLSNVNFSLRRVLAAFGLHDALASDEPADQRINEVNDSVAKDFRSEQAYLDSLPR